MIPSKLLINVQYFFCFFPRFFSSNRCWGLSKEGCCCRRRRLSGGGEEGPAGGGPGGAENGIATYSEEKEGEGGSGGAAYEYTVNTAPQLTSIVTRPTLA